MRTIRTTVNVTEDGTITVPVPGNIPTGQYHAVIVIDEDLIDKSGESPRESLDLTPYPVGLQSDRFTFRREDLYGDG